MTKKIFLFVIDTIKKVKYHKKGFFHFFSKRLISSNVFIWMSSLGLCGSKTVSHVIGCGGVWEILIVKKKFFFCFFDLYSSNSRYGCLSKVYRLGSAPIITTYDNFDIRCSLLKKIKKDKIGIFGGWHLLPPAQPERSIQNCFSKKN